MKIEPLNLKAPSDPMSALEASLREEWAFGLKFSLCVIGAALTSKWTIVPLFQWIGRELGIHIAQVILALVVLAMGIGAHSFKRKHQGWYGITEIVFGSVLAFRVTLSMSIGQAVLSQWTALVGCGYIVARGCSNLSEAVAAWKVVAEADLKARIAADDALLPKPEPVITNTQLGEEEEDY